MADTGAPYFIPYVEPTDLVRDYPAADEAAADAIAAALDAIPVLAGIGSNVVQTVKTDTFTTSSASYVTVTGLTVTITPTAATSKILLVAQVSVGISNGNRNTVALKFAGGNTSTYIANTAGSRILGVTGLVNDNRASLDIGYVRAMSPESEPMMFVDAPATASSVTYSIEVRRGGTGTAFVNQSGADTNNNSSVRGASSLIAIEVAA